MPIDLPPSSRILVVVLARIGDVLLTTPLIRSLKRAWPAARIDVLVFSETAGILAGNPDIENVIAVPGRPRAMQSLALAARLRRRYALAISTQSGDRPTFFALVAGRFAVAPVEKRLSGRIKRMLLRRSVPAAGKMHRVRQMLRLAEAIGVPPVFEVVAPVRTFADIAPRESYAVIHPAPMFRYKRWTAEGWRALAAVLSARGLRVVVSGGPSPAERDYLDALFSGLDVVRADGRLDWKELSGLVSGARLYVGPDTSVTHLAAALGTPTIALYGPTDPVLWGPWPSGSENGDWHPADTIQRRGNIWLIQNPLPCVPCQQEGCERRLGSYSRCLDAMPLGIVAEAIDQVMAAQSEKLSQTQL